MTSSLAAAERFGDARTLVLPPPWYGFSAHHMRFPGHGDALAPRP